MDKKVFDKNILIVDDLEDNILLIDGILEDAGFTNIHSVLSAKECIEYLQHNKIDLIILDIIMPEMDGIDTCKYIRNELNLKDIIVILATANEDIQNLKIGLEDAGANDYIQKPFDNGIELIARVKNLLMLEIQREDEVLKNNEILRQQSKMASMGEMIGNIIHQWRQPLNYISTVASGIKVTQEYTTLDPKTIKEDMDGILEQINYLSNTMDTFKNFIMENKTIEEVVLQDTINASLNIIKASFKDNHIKIINNIDYKDPIKINLVIGELSEVIINILNNARDILVEKKAEDSWVKLDAIKKDSSVLITIEDNGGGIPPEIISKIFNQYFTTKDRCIGTGIGLHMSYQIIVDSLKGSLYVENTQNGAKFFIELPL